MPVIAYATLIFLSAWVIGALQVSTYFSQPDLWWLALLAFLPLGLILYQTNWKGFKSTAVVAGMLSAIVIQQLLRWWF